ncbi:MAG: GGDEF domain-containing protein [Spirochaetes bacterium]|nr:GGDEF domain-containing protein [Spirochaetota bacterium]
MDSKIIQKKRMTFISITSFFFLAMLFLFLNISNMMYKNAGIKLAVKEAYNIQTILFQQMNTTEFDDLNQYPWQSKLDQSVFSLNYYPDIINLKILDPDFEVIYQSGQSPQLETPLKINQFRSDAKGIYYHYTYIKDENSPVYEIFLPFQSDQQITGYLNILFNLQALQKQIFQEKRILFIIILVFNFLITFFLVIMVLNMQKRYYQAKSEIDHIAISDKLTQLFHKDAFMDQLQKELDRTERNNTSLAVISADIDQFYLINEQYGSEFGDVILKTLAEIFKKFFRIFDVIGRTGSDEITIIMVDSDDKQALFAAQRCYEKIKENLFYYNDQQVNITLSFGVASSNQITPEQLDKSKTLLKTLINYSQQALLLAKRNGGNQIIKYGSTHN